VTVNGTVAAADGTERMNSAERRASAQGFSTPGSQGSLLSPHRREEAIATKANAAGSALPVAFTIHLLVFR
jgi:hypothetical protein